jgi:hypothetical protein
LLRREQCMSDVDPHRTRETGNLAPNTRPYRSV